MRQQWVLLKRTRNDFNNGTQLSQLDTKQLTCSVINAGLVSLVTTT